MKQSHRHARKYRVGNRRRFAAFLAVVALMLGLVGYAFGRNVSVGVAHPGAGTVEPAFVFPLA